MILKTASKFLVYMALVVVFSLTSCTNSGGGSGQGFPTGDQNLFDDSLTSGGGNVQDLFGGQGTNNGGSGAGGGLTDADINGLQDVFGGQQDVAPQEDDVLSDFLRAEAERLLEAERQGKQVQAEKMALAGRMLTECAKRVAPLAPIPGQPLMGLWKSTSTLNDKEKKDGKDDDDNRRVFRGTSSSKDKKEKCTIQFNVGQGGIVSGGGGAGGQVAGQGTLAYSVGGGTKGNMRVTNVGDGQIDGKPFSGRVTDRPLAGKGTLTDPKFAQTKYGFESCSTSVSLAQSNNPIPANYGEAMKRMGLCFRQALVLMSPVYDKMFLGMDPQLRVLLMSRMLGLSPSGSSR